MPLHLRVRSRPHPCDAVDRNVGLDIAGPVREILGAEPAFQREGTTEKGPSSKASPSLGAQFCWKSAYVAE
jgi:hypothetical protein